MFTQKFIEFSIYLRDLVNLTQLPNAQGLSLVSCLNSVEVVRENPQI